MTAKRPKQRTKKRINISLDEDTVKVLKELAAASHKNVSQWVSDAVWSAHTKAETSKNAKPVSLKSEI